MADAHFRWYPSSASFMPNDDPDPDCEHDPVPRAEVGMCALMTFSLGSRRCIMCSPGRRRG